MLVLSLECVLIVGSTKHKNPVSWNRTKVRSTVCELASTRITEGCKRLQSVWALLEAGSCRNEMKWDVMFALFSLVLCVWLRHDSTWFNLIQLIQLKHSMTWAFIGGVALVWFLSYLLEVKPFVAAVGLEFDASGFKIRVRKGMVQTDAKCYVLVALQHIGLNWTLAKYDNDSTANWKHWWWHWWHHNLFWALFIKQAKYVISQQPLRVSIGEAHLHQH